MISRVAVIVPAADEEELIGACLAGLQQARQHVLEASRGAVRSRVVVVLDGCRDRTADVVAGFPDVETVLSRARCVGTARRLGAEHVLSLDPSARGLWLANTDADCVVPPDWLTRMAAEAAQGVNLVVGTVRPATGLPEPVERAWLAAHVQRDGHPHVHGANLGLDAESYLALGGWRDLSSGEDSDLVARAVAHGRLTVRRSGAVTVLASSRLSGRAPHGFAGYLAGLAASLPETG